MVTVLILTLLVARLLKALPYLHQFSDFHYCLLFNTPSFIRSNTVGFTLHYCLKFEVLLQQQFIESRKDALLGWHLIDLAFQIEPEREHGCVQCLKALSLYDRIFHTSIMSSLKIHNSNLHQPLQVSLI
ncbi:UNVERIFIED_CONTAM: hypothetical protein RMT77_004613 [Armadillidium vulgare]